MRESPLIGVLPGTPSPAATDLPWNHVCHRYRRSRIWTRGSKPPTSSGAKAFTAALIARNPANLNALEQQLAVMPVGSGLGFYAPSGVVSLHYAGLGYRGGSYRLGCIDGDLSSVQDQAESFTVDLE